MVFLAAVGVQSLEVRACADRYAAGGFRAGAFMVALSEGVKAQVSAALDKKDYNKAVDILEQAYSEDSFDDELKRLLAMAHMARGWAMVDAGDLDAALGDFRKAKLVEPEKQAATYMSLGYVSFCRKNFDDALDYLYEAVYLDPRDGQSHELIGQIYYERGRLRDAISEWQTAEEARPGDQQIKDLLGRARKELGVEKDFTKRETYYFTIKYEGEENRQLGDRVLDIMNQAYSDVSGDLGYYPNEPINVILYTRRQFVDLTGAPSWSGGVFDGNIRIPVGGNNIDPTTLAAVLHHEYTHAVVHMMVGHALPTWLDEGIAEYEEHWARKSKVRLRTDALLPLSSLSGSFMGIGDSAGAEQAYAESLSAVSFYIDRFGMYSLTRLLRLMGEGKGLSDAMEVAAGVTLKEFDDLWQGSVRSGAS